MNTSDTQRLAEEAYNAYAARAEWKTPEGRPMPEWAHAGTAVQERWLSVVLLLSQRLEKTRRVA